jgi:hypothetical protein
MCLYSVVSVLFILLIYRIVQRGPEAIVPVPASVPMTVA